MSVVWLYITTTLCIFIYTFHSKLVSSQNYFSAILIYMSDPTTNFIFYNMAFATVVIIYKASVRIFFVESKQSENIKIMDKLKNKIFDLLIFVYIIDLKFSFIMYGSLLVIMLMFILHYHANFRSEYIIHTPSNGLSLSLNYRLMAFYLIIIFVDYQILKACIPHIFNSDSITCMFIYYMITIFLSLLEPFVQFNVDFYQKFTFKHFKNADQFLAFISVLINVPRHLFQLAVGIWIGVKFGILIFCLITVIESYSALKETLDKYRRVKKLTQTMKNLKTIDSEELKNHDITCMVCFQDMTEATLLPCKHCFHEECLRLWIIKNANHFCPKCKRQFNFDQGQNAIDPNPINPLQQNLRQQPHENLLEFQKKNQRKEKKQKKHHKQQKNKRQERQKQRNKQNQLQKDQYIIEEREQKYFKEEKEVQLEFKFEKQKKNRQKVDLQMKYVDGLSEQNSVEYSQNEELNSEYPYEYYESERRKILRIGSLPYGMPVQAVYNRSQKHIRKWRVIAQGNENVLKVLNLKKVEQLLLFTE